MNEVLENGPAKSRLDQIRERLDGEVGEDYGRIEFFAIDRMIHKRKISGTNPRRRALG